MYPILIQQSEATATRRRVPIWLVDVTDGITAETGITGTPRIAKTGVSSADATNAIVEVDATNMPGLYYLELTQAECDTIGTIFVSFKTAATAQWHGAAQISAPVNVTQVSDDTTAADNLETMLDGTGGQVLSLGQLNIVASGGNSAVVVSGNGAGHGIVATGGATGDGARYVGGATSGDGLNTQAVGGGRGIHAIGIGANAGVRAVGGATGDGIRALGGATSGDGLHAAAQTAGDGIEAVGVGGGFDINADVQGNVSGSVGSVTAGVTVTTNNDKTGYALTVADKNDIADRVWDEDIEAAHGTDATAGLLLRALGQAISNAPRDANLRDQLREIIAVIEHKFGPNSHQPQGNIIFVDPVNGDTHANGNRGGIGDPYLGVQDAHDNAVVASNHDVIILIAGDTAGVTTLTEDVVLTKRYLSIRGPGRDFVWTRVGSGDTIAIAADGIELADFALTTAASGAGNGVTASAVDFVKLDRLWIDSAQGDSIELSNCDRFLIQNCVLQNSGAGGTGHGISVMATAGETASYGRIRNNYITDVLGDGIQLATVSTGIIDGSVIEHNVIQGCSSNGINLVDANVTDVFLHSNRLGNNTSSDIADAGTNTLNQNNVPWLTSPLQADALSAAAVSAAAGNKIADHIIRRTAANARASSNGDAVDFRSMLGAMSKLVNKIDTVTTSGRLTIFEEDDSTTFAEQLLTTDAAADPITVADTV
jgi:hypothetical protein